MKSIIISMLLIVCVSSSYAQKEANWWYFGINSGLNFNNLQTVTSSAGLSTPDMPTPVKGPLNTGEGSFTISDSEGNLLMSGDGVTIYNPLNAVMANGTGMLGGSSSTQSGIILPVPGSNSLYYAVSVMNNEGAAGITYSIVDMSLNGGNGAVTSTKNVQILAGPTDENITATRKRNSPNFWLIHRRLSLSDTAGCVIHVWEVTPTGIENHKIYTFAVQPPGSVFFNAFSGYLKTSSDGTKFISAVPGGKPRASILSGLFNPQTGVPSDVRVRNPSTLHWDWYNFDFSPSGKNVFITGSNYSPTNSRTPLQQITWNDLRNTTKEATYIPADTVYVSSLQLAADGRLYGVRISHKDMVVVMNPEEDYASADVRFFPNYLINDAAFGLPNFMSAFFVADVQGQSFACMGNEATYTVEITMSGTPAENAVKLIWDFGDGSPTIEQPVALGTTIYKQSHVFSAVGTYTIVVTPYKADNTPLKALNYSVRILDCSIMTNRMVRTRLLNSALQQ
ncbi:PKD domain-containing protein [Dysgonomonas sp. GY617]|uniref:PKD domain-containing protein n=1 Tax=Dysgonomonas sp. GY617 TaxID=2780420 RepID=UPI0018834A9F|nr:PKD domain-containing protein [Dysgonomonas sp. GY617]MBF0575593.1 PKD domain-containing protein [Dysgonomonas sp. GY617]